MNTLLLIDAATSVCRVGVANEESVLAERTEYADFKHAEQLTILIENCMQQAAQSYEDLAALAITGGPGSYTGLRIGASVAKGIAFANDLPMLALNTLEVMAKGFANSRQVISADEVIVPMIDARRMEVFTAAYSSDGQNLIEPKAMILEKGCYSQLSEKKCHFFGDGSPKIEGLFSGSGSVDNKMFLSIEAMRQLAFRDFNLCKFVDVAYYRPDYHKDFYTASANK